MRYGFESTLNMYARSYCHLPAKGLYIPEALTQIEHVSQNCHIYIIGYLATPTVTNIILQDGNFVITLQYLGKTLDLTWLVPPDWQLMQHADQYILVNHNNERFSPRSENILDKFSEDHGPLPFHVKYIGQAYGTDGSRNAIHRLLEHPTLQKMALSQCPEGHSLHLILLEIEPNNRVIFSMNPHAQIQDTDGTRLKAGVDKLYNTSEIERISIYEASLIRYFSPEFNIQYKNSFPSTNSKILSDCYDKDFAGVVSEICFDNMPFSLWSESIAPNTQHIAHFDLHGEASRRAFFYAS